MALTLLFTTGILFWLPLAIPKMAGNVHHYCGHCGVHMATYHRTGRTDWYQ